MWSLFTIYDKENKSRKLIGGQMKMAKVDS